MSNIPVSIESPVKYYDFTDQHGDVLATLKFVPTDLDIFERQQNVYKAFEDMWMELKETLDSKKEDELSLEIINKYAKSLQDKFDYLFNADTSGFFKIASPFTPMETGDPWALVILESVKKIIEQETGKNFTEMESKAGKYTQQYNAGPGKYPFPVK
ncbi:hypothetical protein ACP5WH_24615 [Enterocloster bolteae]|jgi:hypothetical protein|uniref:hypothetical protein n=1 Tax=Enterocloster bolteae TaxID=208479 RepID=UPI0002D17E71|nr:MULTISPECIES: hypothetical protein [Enterocloster]ENZ36698.1 hypothetical protein HMPREF1089_05784 [Enterocloster bolteae 90B3]MBS7003284.1 hypothetical protein [Enterocloster clostridioformis]RGB91069.1 hypothetical protein DWZ21_29705 [Hungatella hathewayi]